MNRIFTKTVAVVGIATLLSFSSGVSAAELEIDFEGAEFTEPTTIDNIYWPHTPGLRHVYAAETEDGCELNMVTAIGPSPVIFEGPYDGLTALDVEDLEWLSEECDEEYTLMERTTDRYAQDDDDNIWYLGETTWAYEDEEDCLTDEGAWQAGDDEAEAGIVVLGDPIEGLAYSQEYLEDEAEDMGKVLKLNVSVELENFGPFTDCLKTKEWTPLERGHIEHKFYCPTGGGLMLIKEKHGGTVRVEYIGQEIPDGLPMEFDEELLECGE